MPQLLKTIEEYATEENKNKDTYWIVFNTVYNDVHAFGKEIEDLSFFYLNKEHTNYEQRDELLEFMKRTFPDVKLTEVFDLVNSNYLQYPYLGSIAIDCEKDDATFKVLSQKYGNPYEEAHNNNAVFWVIDYENAKKFHDEKLEILNFEFDD